MISPWKGIFSKDGVRGYMAAANVTVDEEKVRADHGFPDSSPAEFTQAVHAAGMRLVMYTFYDSREPTQTNIVMPRGATGRRGELGAMFQAGVDAVFVENVAEAKSIRDEWALRLELTGKGW